MVSEPGISNLKRCAGYGCPGGGGALGCRRTFSAPEASHTWSEWLRVGSWDWPESSLEEPVWAKWPTCLLGQLTKLRKRSFRWGDLERKPRLPLTVPVGITLLRWLWESQVPNSLFWLVGEVVRLSCVWPPPESAALLPPLCLLRLFHEEAHSRARQVQEAQPG